MSGADVGSASSAGCVYLARHGESLFNVAYVDKDQDPRLFDPVLTVRGRLQSRRLGQELAKIDPDLIVASPLVRALQTAQIAADGRWPIRAMAEFREKQYNSCDVGTPASQLVARFPDIDLSAISERWWYAGDHQQVPVRHEPMRLFLERVVRFRAHITRQSLEGGSRVVYIGHQTFFESLIGYALDNCEMLALDHSVITTGKSATNGVSA